MLFVCFCVFSVVVLVLHEMPHTKNEMKTKKGTTDR